MITNVQPSAQYSKTYATYEAAVKAAEKLLVEFKQTLEEMRISARYIVAAVPETNRFSPIFINTQSAGIWFIQKNFTVAG